jgi:antirestriction protein ArdC
MTATGTTTNDKLAAAHETLTRAVEELVSGADWAAMLAVAARFHRYSANNVMLILAQRPDATRVAGYRAWQSLGRQVRKGERGLAILAPVVVRRRRDETAEESEPTAFLAGFKVVHVFDLGQTEGESLPDVAPVLLAGEGPAALWNALVAQVAGAGFALDRADCGPANGCTDYLARRVSVAPGVDAAQATKTLAHELAHVLLHDGTEYAAGCRGVAEVEAESVAFLVCQAAGLDASGYSFPYVAHWAGGEARAVMATAERVLGAARRILDGAGLGGGGGED